MANLLISADLHCHTLMSGDSQTTYASLLAACRKKGLDRIAITDHNTIAGAREAQRLDPERVIIGEEIMTTGGEILGFYIQEEVPEGLSPRETIGRLRDQGAVISVSHPFDVMRSGSWKIEALLEIAPLVDAIEVFNARCDFAIFNHKAKQFAREHNLNGTAGSDAHAAIEIGAAHLRLPAFSDAEGLHAALRQAEVEGRRSGFWVHIFSRWAKHQKKQEQKR